MTVEAPPRPAVPRAITTLEPFDLDTPTLGGLVADWIEEMLVQPDGEHAGEPLELNSDELNFVLHWYALRDDGSFLHRKGTYRRPKGFGKSPLMAMLCLAEMLGPVRFGGWDSDGNPIGVPQPAAWVQLAGVSETQTANTMTCILGMIEDAPIRDHYAIDPGLSRIFGPGGSQIRPITASSATQEGARPTFTAVDEPHVWFASNGGHALAQVINRNLAKVRGGTARTIETTNAYEPGLDSVAERTHRAWLKQEEGLGRTSGILYDSREAPPWVSLTDEVQLRAALVEVYGDATWVDVDRLVAEIYDLSNPPEQSRRFYLNQVTAAADAWVAPHEWDACKVDDLRPLSKTDAIVLGFDGGRTDDSTALVAIRLSDGSVWLIEIWERPEGPAGTGWEVPQEVVRGVMDHTFASYNVVGLFCDRAEWETDVDRWADLYRGRLKVKATPTHAVSYDMRGHLKEITETAEATNRAIREGSLPHSGDKRLTRHVHNARRRPNRFGVSFGKEHRESPRKVDAVAAMILARVALNRARAAGLTRNAGQSGLYIF